jgi:hypothetical protein
MNIPGSKTRAIQMSPKNKTDFHKNIALTNLFGFADFTAIWYAVASNGLPSNNPIISKVT